MMNKLAGAALALGALAVTDWALNRTEEPLDAPEGDLPEQTEIAAVLEKQRRSYNPGSAVFSNVLTFIGEDGGRRCFEVPGDCFRRLQPGDRGVLTYAPAQDGRAPFFVSFARDNDGEVFMAYI